ncbi:MAG: ribosomal-processing cysteine protease Prp [Oscillospiraceae bacterium]|jgi:uncharacterized protein YsxB (DUF464 family)|nr:ribosomal-processing cysteine protease Prp [Oscillospiraceae bacterium]
MIKVEFFSQEGRRTGFSVSGHSGYAEAGADVICAAVTAIVRYAEATLNDILGVGAKTRVDAEKALITLTLPASCEDEDTVQAILDGMMLTLVSLRDENPDYIEVMEV